MEEPQKQQNSTCRGRYFIGVTFLLLAAASLHIYRSHQSGKTAAPSPQADPDPYPSHNIKVIRAEPGHIHAEFGPIGFIGKFEGEKTGISKLYTTDGKSTLIETTNSAHGAVIAYRGFPKVIINGSLGVERLQPHMDLITKAHRQFETLKECKSLPAMAFALAARGIQGNSHPAALWLFTSALQYAKTHPNWKQGDFTSKNPHVDTEDLIEVRKNSLLGERKKDLQVSLQAKVETVTKGPKTFSETPIKVCGNDCFGRCGNGCSCWKFVCGTCNSHRGCWEHDCWCSCFTNSHYRCYTFQANELTCSSWICAAKYCLQVGVIARCSADIRT